jgi:hypothetical protein
VLDEQGQHGAAARLGEGEGGHRLGVRQSLVDLGRHDPLVRDDLQVLAVERGLGPVLRR